MTKSKKCSGKYGCGKIKIIDLFYSNNRSKDGLNIRCIECEKIYYKIKQKRKKLNRENILPKGMKRCIGGTGCNKIKNINLFAIRSDTGNRRNQCIDCQNKIKRKWEISNPEIIREKNRRWRKNNPEKSKNKLRRWRKNNPSYFKRVDVRLSKNLRSRLNAAIKNNQKSGSAINDLGCSIEELKQYLEKQFYSHPDTGEQMNWDNYGMYGWHMDHIRPLASFDLTNREEVKIACHYTNLQPLWAQDNLSKGDRIF